MMIISPAQLATFVIAQEKAEAVLGRKLYDAEIDILVRAILTGFDVSREVAH